MTRTEEFEQLRPLLSAIAYRILGSVAEAEDRGPRDLAALRSFPDTTNLEQGLSLSRGH
jgi:RNA polymerase sigma-70 factor, ECF subfamily